MQTSSAPHSDIIQGLFHSSSGTVERREYARGQFLGKGGFAECYEVKDLKTGEILAAKIVSKSSLVQHRARLKLDSEIRIHKSLKHPGVVRFEGALEDAENVYMLLELCAHKSLRELLSARKKVTELEAQCYTAQLVGALQYLHSRNIVHRDVKLRNLFLASHLQLKVGDFGLSAQLGDRGERRRTVCGTANYMAPEVLDVARTGLGHSFEVDTWAVGVVLYTLLLGAPPFDSPTVKQIYRKILRNQYVLGEESGVSREAANLIRRILVARPEERPSLEEILEDPFMTRNPYPPLMPISTLSLPPSPVYLSQYVNAANVTQFVTDRDIYELRKPESNLNASGSTHTKSNLCVRKTCAETPHNRPGKSISRKATEQAADCMERTKSTKEPTPVLVDRCMDYTGQYGVGYVFTDGTVGFFYNDRSNLQLLQDGQYCYVGSAQNGVMKCKANECPKELGRKVKVFEKFKEFHSPSKQYREESAQEEVFVKIAIKSNNGVLLRLSNNIIQMMFKDRWQVAVCLKSKLVLTANEKGERSSYKTVKELLQSGNESAKNRLHEALKLMKLGQAKKIVLKNTVK